MAKFTGGVVSYLRRVNTGNYEHKEFKAEISWSCQPEDDQATAEEWQERAANEAVAIVHQRLGLVEPNRTEAFYKGLEAGMKEPRPTVTVASLGSGVPTVTVEHSPEEIAAAVEARKKHNADPETRHAVAAEPVSRVRRTKAELAAGLSIEEAAKRRAAPDPLTDNDPLAEVPPVPLSDAESGPNADVPTASDATLSDDPLTAALPDLSDEEIFQVAQKKAHALGDALEVRKVIGRYAPQVSAIPQSRRREFVAEIEALG